MTAVVVLVEGGGPGGAPVRKPTLELLAIARRLGDPAAVICGPADDRAVRVLGAHGATVVYAADFPGFGEYLVVPKVDLLAEVVRRTAPAAVLVTSGPEGKEIAARLAVRLDTGIVTDAVDVHAGADGPIVTQSAFAGTWSVRSRVRGGTPIITVRPNAVRPEPVAAAAPTVQTCPTRAASVKP